MKWAVQFSKKAEADIFELIKEGIFSEEDREVLSIWIKQVQEYGPESLLRGNFWHDHELYDEWKGHRSSAYSFKGRIIYKIQDKIVTVLVIKITATHNYKKD